MFCQRRGKNIILKDKWNANNLVVFDHYTTRNSQICSLNELLVKSYI